MMTTLVYVIAYIGIAFFFVAVIARFMMWSKMPMHLRWELYPVAHEGGGRAAYGGSYLEESDWWKKKREVSMLGELKVMVPEILFLVALREHNSKLWKWSFPFHFGLYLVAGATIVMLAAGLIGALLPAGIATPINNLIAVILPFLGGAGLILGIIGALGLFARRCGRSLRDYTAPADIFNLAFFITAFGVALILFAVFDRDFSIVSAFVANLVTFKLVPLEISRHVLSWVSTSVVLLALEWRLALVVLIPLPIMAVGLRWFNRRARPIYRRVRDRLGDINARLQDDLAGIRVIQAFGQEEAELARFRSDRTCTLHKSWPSTRTRPWMGS